MNITMAASFSVFCGPWPGLGRLLSFSRGFFQGPLHGVLEEHRAFQSSEGRSQAAVLRT